MASTWTNAELRLMATGENDNTWGDQTNYNLQRVDDMVNAYIGVTLSGASKTLDFSNDPTTYTAGKAPGDQLTLVRNAVGARNRNETSTIGS